MVLKQWRYLEISEQQGYSKQPSKGNNGPVNQTLGKAPIAEQLSICACNPQKHEYYMSIYRHM